MASISEAKAKLSELLDLVRAGDSVMISDRGIPVARLVPPAGDADDNGRLARLERAGLIRRGGGRRVDVLMTAPPDVGGGVVDALLEDRRAGR